MEYKVGSVSHECKAPLHNTHTGPIFHFNIPFFTFLSFFTKLKRKKEKKLELLWLLMYVPSFFPSFLTSSLPHFPTSFLPSFLPNLLPRKSELIPLRMSSRNFWVLIISRENPFFLKYLFQSCFLWLINSSGSLGSVSWDTLHPNWLFTIINKTEREREREWKRKEKVPNVD